MDQIRISYDARHTVTLEQLTDFQGDVKTITKTNIDKLKASIEKHGFFVPIFVWQKTPTSKVYIIDGHQRLKALESFAADGYQVPEIPVEFIGAKSKKDAAAKLLAVTSQFGDFDLTGLADFTALYSLELPTMDIRLVDTEIQLPEQDPEVTTGDDDVDLDVKAETKPGDLWLLGKHRLLCGDATNEEDVRNLLARQSPFIMVTDPPYGVNYEPEWRNDVAAKGHLERSPRRTGIVPNDDRADWGEAWRLFPGSVAYTWSPTGGYVVVTGAALEREGFVIRNMLIWKKPRIVLSRGAYNGQHECLWYAVRKGKAAKWIGKKNESSVWEISNVLTDAEGKTNHSTQKPVECMARPIRNHTGDVYDPFIGSGTTFIAAEKEGRMCYGMELDPGYCDVTVARYKTWCGNNGRECVVSKRRAGE